MKQIQANMPAEKTWHNASFVRSFRRNAKETAAESYKTKHEPEVYRGLQADALEQGFVPRSVSATPKKKVAPKKKVPRKEKKKVAPKKEAAPEKKVAPKRKAVRYLYFIFQ